MAFVTKDNQGPSTGSISRPSSSLSTIQWEDAPTEFTRRSGVIVEVWGETATGRTHFALTAPGPIAYLYFHEKVEGVIQKFAKEKEIKCIKLGGSFRGTEEEIKRAAWEQVEKFETYHHDAFKWARTVIWDTHNEAWLLERLGEFGDFKPAKGRVDRNYGGINARWNSLLNKARSGAENVNFILVGQAEDEWKSDGGFDKKTGRKLRVSTTASNQVYLKSDISIKTHKENGIFSCTIHKGWFNADVEDVIKLENEEVNFCSVLGLVTETDPEEWR